MFHSWVSDVSADLRLSLNRPGVIVRYVGNGNRPRSESVIIDRLTLIKVTRGNALTQVRTWVFDETWGTFTVFAKLPRSVIKPTATQMLPARTASQ